MAEPLSCKELEQRLNLCLDMRRDPKKDPAVDLHIQTCDECSELVRGHDMVHSYLEDSKSTMDELEVDVSNSVVTNWSHLFPEPKTRAWRTSSYVIGFCVMILLPISLIWFAWPRGNPAATPDPSSVASSDLEQPEGPGTGMEQESTDVVFKSIQDMLGTADEQMDWMNAYRPTMQFFGVSTMFNSLDLTFDMLMDQFKKDSDPNDPPEMKSNDQDPVSVEKASDK